MRKHLAIFSDEFLNAVLSGKKSIESRFSQKRIPPFGEVNIGDLVYIKPPGKEIIGQFRVEKVISFEGLGEEDWEIIKSKFAKKIGADDKYFKTHLKAKYGTLIFIGNLEQFITPPVRIRKSDQRGWVVLDKIKESLR